jgi:stage II sporulation protein D
MRRALVVLGVCFCLPGSAGAATTFLVDGKGWGHGVGMSQYGARGFAESGWNHERILKHYYRGTVLERGAPRPVRVLLLEGRPEVKIGSTKGFKVVDARGKKKALKPGTQNVRAGKIAAARLPLRFEPGAAPLVLDGKAYRGALLVHRVGGRLVVVNKLPLDRYLRGVVPWEMPDDWHAEALKAQAVVARSYALATLKPGTLYDLYADTRSQVYGGIEAESFTTNVAIGATAGQVLTWRGRVATTFYHSTSGGRTVSVAEAWPRARPVPYLVSVPDPHDDLSKHHRWGTFRWTPEGVAARLGLRGVTDVRVERGPSGRVRRVHVLSGSGTRTVLSQDFRRALDLRSTWFDWRVLHLRVRGGRALASGAKPVVLTGFVRGVAKAQLEQQVAGGPWRAVRPVRAAANGRFTVTVRPTRTTAYRLATPSGAGALVTVRKP